MEFTGERYVPDFDINSEISIYHMQRYLDVLRYCKDKCVLDAACGEGYGSNLLSDVAKNVIGVDISDDAISNAQTKYKKDNLTFIKCSVTDIPIESGFFDIVISFETIEHVNESQQIEFFEQIKRLLKPDGVLIMSSPDKLTYSDIPEYNNPYHQHELYFSEFDSLVKKYFKYGEYYYQGMLCNSYVFKLNGNYEENFERITLNKKPETSRAEYIIGVCYNDSKWEDKIDLSVITYDGSNTYYKMKKDIENLKNSLGEPGKIIEQKENYINEQREIISQKDNEIRELNGIIEQKENYINEQRGIISERDNEIREKNGIIEQKENYINEQIEIIEKQTFKDYIKNKFKRKE